MYAQLAVSALIEAIGFKRLTPTQRVLAQAAGVVGIMAVADALTKHDGKKPAHGHRGADASRDAHRTHSHGALIANDHRSFVEREEDRRSAGQTQTHNGRSFGHG